MTEIGHSAPGWDKPPVIIVGDAPADMEKSFPLLGKAAEKISELAGIHLIDYSRRTTRINVIPVYPGGIFPSGAARVWAQTLTRIGIFQTDSPVVLLGSNVAKAFDISRAAWFRWTRPIEVLGVRCITKVVSVPHPSARSAWWQDPHNEVRAERFWQANLW